MCLGACCRVSGAGRKTDLKNAEVPARASNTLRLKNRTPPPNVGLPGCTPGPRLQFSPPDPPPQTPPSNMASNASGYHHQPSPPRASICSNINLLTPQTQSLSPISFPPSRAKQSKAVNEYPKVTFLFLLPSLPLPTHSHPPPPPEFTKPPESSEECLQSGWSP